MRECEEGQERERNQGVALRGYMSEYKRTMQGREGDGKI